MSADLADYPEEKFCQYILYVAANNAPSSKALEILKTSTIAAETLVWDVRSKQPPGWLRGVPVICDQGAQEAYAGAECYRFLQTREDVMPAEGATTLSAVAFAYDADEPEPTSAGPIVADASVSSQDVNALIAQRAMM